MIWNKQYFSEDVAGPKERWRASHNLRFCSLDTLYIPNCEKHLPFSGSHGVHVCSLDFSQRQATSKSASPVSNWSNMILFTVLRLTVNPHDLPIWSNLHSQIRNTRWHNGRVQHVHVLVSDPKSLQKGFPSSKGTVGGWWKQCLVLNLLDSYWLRIAVSVTVRRCGFSIWWRWKCCPHSFLVLFENEDLTPKKMKNWNQQNQNKYQHPGN